MANPLKMLKLKPTSFQFIQEIPIDAPPGKVWKSILNLPGWWFFEGHPMKAAGPIKAKAGSMLVLKGKGVEMLQGVVTHVEPWKLLRLGGTMGTNHTPVNSAFIFELQPKGKGTLLRFGQRTFGLIDPDMKKNMQRGWGTLFKQLKALAEK
jgi:uncharacterized protein YndB with AHSA1/START domain